MIEKVKTFSEKNAVRIFAVMMLARERLMMPYREPEELQKLIADAIGAGIDTIGISEGGLDSYLLNVVGVKMA
jgi:hypothetical protein